MITLLSVGVLAMTAAGCGSGAKDGIGAESMDRAPSVVDGHRYDLITPTGEKIMAANFRWQTEQEQDANARRFAQPAQCATNVSKVFELAGLAHYKSPLVPALVAQVKARGGKVRLLPKSSQAIARIIDQEFGGRIPVGTLVSGCLRQDCSGAAGDGHIAVVGDLQANGALKVYHNNWYRPDNEGGVWKTHMIPLSWYNKGFRRKYMPTPWITIERDESPESRPVNVRIELPAIDDLDPTNYFVTLSVPAEIMREL
jgi:hypothetical protein